MAKKDKGPIPYVILDTDHAQNLRFYERYDEYFLFNKVATFLYILEEGEPVIKQIEEYLIANGGASAPKKYLESIRAEIFFATLHQCEVFFALLAAPFQPLPHWLYLTVYETKEIKQVIDQFIAGKINDITEGRITTIEDFIKVAIYNEAIATDPQLANRWDENIDNIVWLIKRVGKFFLKYDRAYNSYKHGLRVMTGPHQLAIGIHSFNAPTIGPMHVIQASEDSVTYLQKEPVREVDGKKEIPIGEITKSFNPFEASFYMAKMSQMLETIKATRLAQLGYGRSLESINIFLSLNRDEVQQLERHDEYKQVPTRADEAWAYSKLFDQIRANVKQQTDDINLGDHSKPSDDGRTDN